MTSGASAVTGDEILGRVERYYTGKLTEYGATPAGVDWSSAESQQLRFDELLRVVRDEPFSINDYGCGYGALAAALASRWEDFAYTGFDLSGAMADEAGRRLGGDSRCRIVRSEAELERADYTIASGILNVRLDTPEEKWRDYVLRTVDRLAELSAKGFAFNALTSYSDPELMRDDLHYANPAELFDHCKRRHSRHVALLHDYGLWEFTIVVRLEGPV